MDNYIAGLRRRTARHHKIALQHCYVVSSFAKLLYDMGPDKSARTCYKNPHFKPASIVW
jgi:hypothetical protein